MEIKYSNKFINRYKKLPIEIKKLAEKIEKIFKNNPFDIRLKTYKLHGVFSEYYAFSINYEYRIIFEFSENNIVEFHNIGKHDIYK